MKDIIRRFKTCLHGYNIIVDKESCLPVQNETHFPSALPHTAHNIAAGKGLIGCLATALRLLRLFILIIMFICHLPLLACGTISYRRIVCRAKFIMSIRAPGQIKAQLHSCPSLILASHRKKRWQFSVECK